MLSSDPDHEHIECLAWKIRELLQDLRNWYSSYEILLSRAPPIFPPSAEYDRRCKVFATYLSCVIISSRLLGAIASTERVKLERGTQILAMKMLDMELEVKTTSSAAALFMAQTLGVAQATLATSEDWLEGEQIAKLESISPEGFTSMSPESEGNPGPTGLIDFWKFEKWNNKCGRKMF